MTSLDTLRELLASVENSLRPIVLASQQLCIEGPDRDVPLTGNRETLASALINLATNALNAGGPAAHVHVVARDAGLQAEIIVVDEGPGVVAELRERIFEPFFTSRSDGTGLGLSVARSIARAHRGDVALVDGSAGSTTFALRLPIAATEVTAQQPHNSQGPPPHELRKPILLVEDDQRLRDALVETLRLAGFDVCLVRLLAPDAFRVHSRPHSSNRGSTPDP